MTRDSELIARLRGGIPKDRWGGLDVVAALDMMREAAAEIERLRSILPDPPVIYDDADYANMVRADRALPLHEQLRKITHIGPYHLREVPREAASRLEAIGEPVAAGSHDAWRARARAAGAEVNETPFGTVTTFRHMDELIAFASPTPSDHVAVPMEPVQVKALEWDRDVGWPRNAETPFGQYKIWAGKDVWFGTTWLRGMHAPTVEDAERWAQEDYEQRILSALGDTK